MLVSLTRINHLSAALRRFTIGAILATLVTALGPVAAQAQGITLSARKQPITVAVVGDSMANDLGSGMEDLFARGNNVQVLKKTQYATGLVRTDYFDWNETIRGFLNQHDPDVIVVLIGGNDHQPIRMDDRRLDPLTRPWIAEYQKRVSQFMRNIKRERAKVYWVGLPAVRSDSLSRAYHLMNKVYRYEARRYGFRYVSIWDEFLSPDGGYTSFGESLEGVTRRLRKNDGMHFTDSGRLSLAAYIAQRIGLQNR
jgi:hypothetical protein